MQEELDFSNEAPASKNGLVKSLLSIKENMQDKG